MAVTTVDYASLYMATEVAYNGGDAEPYLDLFNDEFVFNGNATSRADFGAALRNIAANGVEFRTVGLTAYGPFLIDHGTFHQPDGVEWMGVAIFRFNEAGKIIELIATDNSPA